MAKKTVCDYVTDVKKGTPCQADADVEVSFTQDGDRYALDLCDEHAQVLTTHARKSAPTPASRSTSAKTPSTYPAAAIRRWAEGQGIKVGPKGRIPGDIVQQWREATSAN